MRRAFYSGKKKAAVRAAVIYTKNILSLFFYFSSTDFAPPRRKIRT